MQIPETLKPGDYELKIKGDLKSTQLNSGAELHFKAYLKCEQTFLTILIETNQLVFNVKQTIKIRIVLIDYLMKFYSYPIDIYLYDSRDFLIRRWISQSPLNGLLSLEFVLPKICPLGWWRIEVHAQFQIEKRFILIENWFIDKFEIFVDLNPFTNIEDDYLIAKLNANYTNQLPVHANATIQLIALPAMQTNKTNLQIYGDDYIELWSDFIPEFNGFYEIKLPLQEQLPKLFPYELVNSILEVHVEVKELLYGTCVKGYSKTKLESLKVILKFLDKSPLIFKPGLPLITHLLVTHSNHRALSKFFLLTSTLEIRKSYEALSKFINYNLSK